MNPVLHRRMRPVVAAIAFLTAVTMGAQDRPAGAFARIARLVALDSVEALADLVRYPLGRTNPVPDIRNRAEFVARYAMLFDDTLRDQLRRFEPSDVFQHNGYYGIGAGVLWIDEDGRIIAINHSTAEEQALADSLTRRIKARLHPSVRAFERNVLVYACPQHTLRIDETARGLRLALWNAGRGVHTKPDVVIDSGSYEFYGTQGGIGYTFTRGRWTYLVERIDMCGEFEDECGPFLTISRGGRELSRRGCEEKK